MNYIKRLCEYFLLNPKQLSKLTTIPYRTIENWLYEMREMPSYMQYLIDNTIELYYGHDLMNEFHRWSIHVIANKIERSDLSSWKYWDMAKIEDKNKIFFEDEDLA